MDSIDDGAVSANQLSLVKVETNACCAPQVREQGVIFGLLRRFGFLVVEVMNPSFNLLYYFTSFNTHQRHITVVLQGGQLNPLHYRPLPLAFGRGLHITILTRIHRDTLQLSLNPCWIK